MSGTFFPHLLVVQYINNYLWKGQLLFIPFYYFFKKLNIVFTTNEGLSTLCVCVFTSRKSGAIMQLMLCIGVLYIAYFYSCDLDALKQING
jgi:hypothetical protein